MIISVHEHVTCDHEYTCKYKLKWVCQIVIDKCVTVQLIKYIKYKVLVQKNLLI